MYCRYCGKEIADDSAFCQYCGGQIQEGKKQKISFLKRFQSLNRGWQICIMGYIVWLLAGVCVLVGLGPYGYYDGYYHGSFSEVLWPVLLAVVVIPMAALFFWYYYSYLRKSKPQKPKKKKKGKRGKRKSDVKSTTDSVKIVSFPLMDFVEQYGRMQVKTVANPTTNEVRSYCVFINEQGLETKVEFGESLGVLRPQEISERKEQLIVVQQIDGTFELIEK